MNKRNFIKNISIMGIGITTVNPIGEWVKKYEAALPAQLAEDEIFWQGIRKEFRLKTGLYQS